MFASQISRTNFRSNAPLSDDQIRRIAPSVYAAEAHESRSARYTYIPTIDVLNGLRKEGFEPFSVMQGRTRVPGKADFTKHLLRLRHRSNEGAVRNVGDEFNEIILINSHDGTSSYQMMSGVYRVICSNGMCVQNATLQDIRVPHKGNIIQDVVQGAYNVLDGFGIIRDVTEEMKSIRLLPAEQSAFADAALELRYDEGEHRPIEARQLLSVRRSEDRRDDVWTTFNRVQENTIRGGLHGRNANGGRTSTRPVTAIDGDVKLNRALWKLAEAMANIKASQAAQAA